VGLFDDCFQRPSFVEPVKATWKQRSAGPAGGGFALSEQMSYFFPPPDKWFFLTTNVPVKFPPGFDFLGLKSKPHLPGDRPLISPPPFPPPHPMIPLFFYRPRCLFFSPHPSKAARFVKQKTKNKGGPFPPPISSSRALCQSLSRNPHAWLVHSARRFPPFARPPRCFPPLLFIMFYRPFRRRILSPEKELRHPPSIREVAQRWTLRGRRVP